MSASRLYKWSQDSKSQPTERRKDMMVTIEKKKVSVTIFEEGEFSIHIKDNKCNEKGGSSSLNVRNLKDLRDLSEAITVVLAMDGEIPTR